MAFNNFRNKTKGESDRRTLERRIILFPFGSAQWIKQIQKDYLLWPKNDRRLDDRRKQFLEQCRRRQKKMTQFLSKLHSGKQQNLLTLEEKEMLNELSQSDLTDID